MRSIRQPNCKHDPLRDMDHKRDQEVPGAFIERFWCRECKREMMYITRPRQSQKRDAELAVTALVRDY